jgi:hypothetical protein
MIHPTTLEIIYKEEYGIPIWQLENTDEVAWNAHSADQCLDEICVLHNMTEHNMRSFPQHWRSDRGIVERVTPFGCACPDPDQIPFLKRIHPTVWRYDLIHGCVANPADPLVSVCSPWSIDNVPAAWINKQYAVTEDGRVWSYVNGYERPVELSQRDIRKRKFKVDRLVLSAWRGPGSEILHLDGNLDNNALDNLLWVTG